MYNTRPNMPHKSNKNRPRRVVITPEAAGSPWDCWDDRRHGAAEVSFPRCTEAALISWEDLLGRA
jgi:hypothetical protein